MSFTIDDEVRQSPVDGLHYSPLAESPVPVVHVVDDDAYLRDAVRTVLKSADISVQAYASAEDFLERFEDPDASQCLLLDVWLPGLSGLQLQKKLMAEAFSVPIVMISAEASVALAVDAMRTGAIDFLEKPFHSQALISCLRRAFERHAALRRRRSQQQSLVSQTALLSAREREVMELLVAAKGAKEIASILRISVKTVATHRARVLDKMGVDSPVELARRVLAARIDPSPLRKST